MVLQPLCCASHDTMLRLRQVMGAMLADLLSRVLLDRWGSEVGGRWALTVKTVTLSDDQHQVIGLPSSAVVVGIV
jgi:hypothetical protein